MWKKLTKNNQGMSLIEVMILVTVMSIIGLGSASLMKNMSQSANRSSARNSIDLLRDNLNQLLQDENAWNNTVNDPANTGSLGCFRSGTPACANPYNVAVANINIRDASGGLWYEASLATTGFTYEGQTCATYAAAGNDACPLRYNFAINSACTGAACPNPRITITATLANSPLNTSDTRIKLNLGNYVVNVIRGELDRFQVMEARYVENGNAGGGACNPGGDQIRPLNQFPFDEGDNSTPGANAFTLAPGSYKCKVVTQNYEATAGTLTLLRDTTNNVDYNVGSSNSALFESTYTLGSVSFNVTNAGGAAFQVITQCGASNSAFDMGIPTDALGGYAAGPGTVFTSVVCVRSS